MEKVSSDVKAFLQDHPYLQLTDSNKVKCTLNGHELPCRLEELRKFTSGKKYQQLSAIADFDYRQYEPHVVPSTKQPNQLFCKLTLRHINRLPHHVLQHVGGKRYQRALQKYEACVLEGVQYVPACLKQKKPREEGEKERSRGSSRKKGFWEPESSEGDASDSEDSMSDLYPPEMFTLKAPGDGEMEEAMVVSEGFETDSGDEAPAGRQNGKAQMEVDTQTFNKRKKVQSASLKKRFKSHHKKGKGFKKAGKVKNVK
ncbi:surfeit locus protein 2 [Lepisosteus oculatus]|nr:PREDICTED: surfeit locus protein 2 [Lepisosteus oculatus]